MKTLNSNERMEEDGFSSYLSREYEECLNMSPRKGRNNIYNAWQRAILNKLVRRRLSSFGRASTPGL